MVLNLITLIIVYIVCTIIEDKTIGLWLIITNLLSIGILYIFTYCNGVTKIAIIIRCSICITSLLIKVYWKIRNVY